MPFPDEDEFSVSLKSSDDSITETHEAQSNSALNPQQLSLLTKALGFPYSFDSSYYNAWQSTLMKMLETFPEDKEQREKAAIEAIKTAIDSGLSHGEYVVNWLSKNSIEGWTIPNEKFLELVVARRRPTIVNHPINHSRETLYLRKIDHEEAERKWKVKEVHLKAQIKIETRVKESVDEALSNPTIF